MSLEKLKALRDATADVHRRLQLNDIIMTLERERLQRSMPTESPEPKVVGLIDKDHDVIRCTAEVTQDGKLLAKRPSSYESICLPRGKTGDRRFKGWFPISRFTEAELADLNWQPEKKPVMWPWYALFIVLGTAAQVLVRLVLEGHISW